jgi:4-hydroxybenzoate polyprenyltransferase
VSALIGVEEPERLTADVGVGRDLISLLRVAQWPKNILVVPIVLIDLHVWSLSTVWRVAWAVIAFTVAATVVYVVNDIVDQERDRAHPTKRWRSIASGRVSVRKAIALAAFQFAVLIGVLSLEPWSWSWPIAAYLVLNTGYSIALKHAPLVDIFVVAGGFGLRVLLGYVVAGVAISGWLLTCAFSLCLLLCVGKRRQELVATDGVHRPALRGYTVQFTDQLMAFCGVLAAVSYLLYVRTEAPLGGYGQAAAIVTVPLALFGLFRYLQLVLVYEGGADPVNTLLRDPALVINSLLWAGLILGFLLVSHFGWAM